MANNMNFLYKAITDKIVKMLEDGTAPWTKPWVAEDAPQNLTTKIPYNGINVWLLLASPHAKTKYWLTWKQVQSLKGRVKKEENKNYELVVFWKQLKSTELVNGEEKEKVFPMIRYTRVYNLSQCEFDQKTLDKIVPKEEEKKPFVSIENCENIVENYKDCPPIGFGGDRAYYVPLYDEIMMPKKEDFESPEKFYGVLFHEMGHSTGSAKRLNRFKATDGHIFGSETYSKEELVAEMTSSFLCAKAGIDNEVIDNSAAYINGWLKAIKEGDKNMVISAASKASYASNYILGKTSN